MNLLIEWRTDVDLPPMVKSTVRAALQTTWRRLKLKGRAQVFVWVCDEETIQGLNGEHRQLDAVTDVLSFPQTTLTPPSPGFDLGSLRGAVDAVTGRVALGDIALCLPRAAQQAAEYGWTLEREAAFLCLHGLLHLLGWDHIDPADRAAMRAKEKEMMKVLGYES